jgi:hypothetical protein
VDDVHRILGPDAIGRQLKIAFAREGHRGRRSSPPRGPVARC